MKNEGLLASSTLICWLATVTAAIDTRPVFAYSRLTQGCSSFKSLVFLAQVSFRQAANEIIVRSSCASQCGDFRSDGGGLLGFFFSEG